MRKVITVFFCILLVTIVSGCSSKKTTYTTVSLDELNEKIDNKDSFVLTIGSSSCSHCANFQPKMETVIKVHQVEVFYIDVLKLKEKEYKDFLARLNFEGTPTTIFFKDGKETSMSNRIDGDKKIEVIEEKMKKAGFIK